MDKIKIPFSEFSFSYSRSSGPGGQNVNKVNSKVTLSWNPDQSSACSAEILQRFKEKYSRFLLADGTFQLSHDSHRSQLANKDECIARLHQMLESVRRPPKTRKVTKPTRSSIRKRLDSKRKDSEKKRMRSRDYE